MGTLARCSTRFAGGKNTSDPMITSSTVSEKRWFFMRAFALVALAAIGAAISFQAPVQASYVPPGSYSQSCEAIAVVRGYLNAKCQDTSGNWHLAQAYIASCPGGSFANNDGTLVCGRGGFGIGRALPFGSWRASCNNATLAGGILTASCDNSNGSWRTSSLAMANCPSRNVSNVQGSLVCAGGAAWRPGWMQNHAWGMQGQMPARAYAMPGGTWQSTCRNATVQGPILTAQCENGSGIWVQASFDLRRAPGAALVNDNGALVVQQ
jgi:hypothetical protein